MARRPNIVFITTHDTGRHFGCYGVRTVHTPNIDRLAAEGVLMEDFFCTSPVCSPSRGAMMTGLWPQRNGLMGLSHPPSSWTFNDGVQHLSHILRGAGYRTALFYHQHEVMPWDIDRLAFDDWYAKQEGFHRPADTVAAEFASFAASLTPEQPPFYAQIGFGETHRKWDAGGVEPDRSTGVTVPPYLVDNEAARADAALLQGAVRKVDDAVGIILKALEENGLAENTIVVFTVDHGLEFPRAKWYLYDPGIETACLVRWPAGGVDGGHRVRQLVSNVDVTPTLLDLIDVAPPLPLDGIAFTRLLRDPAAPATRDMIFAMYLMGGSQPEARCVRTRTHKLIRNFSNLRVFRTPVDVAAPRFEPDTCPVTQLYDLAADPLEFDNLSGRAEHAAVEADLNGRLWRWLEAVGDPILHGPIWVNIYRASHDAYEQWKRQTAGA
ncbi:MAG: sulfatase [Planctomycetes bacterium]|nr:sulfatase [Planctomycetota bacterium]